MLNQFTNKSFIELHIDHYREIINMPFYEYQCPKCLALTEEFLPISKSEIPIYCTDDNTLMIKQLGATPGYVAGTENPCFGTHRRVSGRK